MSTFRIWEGKTYKRSRVLLFIIRTLISFCNSSWPTRRIVPPQHSVDVRVRRLVGIITRVALPRLKLLLRALVRLTFRGSWEHTLDCGGSVVLGSHEAGVDQLGHEGEG
jgi:hypothetical protein